MSHHTDRLDRVAWVDLSTSDAAAARDFYGALFGWDIEVNADPQYGGYGMGRLDGEDAAGIGPAQDPNAPTAWSIYFGSDDLESLAAKVEGAGGQIVAPPFDVGDQGRMAVFRDPTGAFFSAWQGARMGSFRTGTPNSYNWAEVNARGVSAAVAFYQQVFGWSVEESDMGEGQPPYIRLEHEGHAVGGAWEMSSDVPAEVPSYWLVYFEASDVHAKHAQALELGATELVPPTDFPGGRFSIVTDPQGASFGLYQDVDRQPRT